VPVTDVKTTFAPSGAYGWYNCYKLANPDPGDAAIPQDGLPADGPLGLQAAAHNADTYAYLALASYLPEHFWDPIRFFGGQNEEGSECSSSSTEGGCMGMSCCCQ
jgi:hypothetical protein